MINNYRASIVIPAKNEGENICLVISRLEEAINFNYECIIVVDELSDTTVNFVQQYDQNQEKFKIALNDLGSGPAQAIKCGINTANSKVIVVTMADGSDDPQCIPNLVRLIERGVSIACASRYMPGGQQIGAPLIKSKLSKLAGKSIQFLTRVGTRDATNSFKAYSKDFIMKVGIESQFGFEIGLELLAKAIRTNALVAEVPTIWIERSKGKSNFNLRKGILKYLYWYLYAINPKREVK